ncbi:hypothetical protein G6F60_015371 [Rhizopus arrhizus]|nr:hypothetical protein G6F60_015371 [Rhizopus arrhizus]
MHHIAPRPRVGAHIAGFQHAAQRGAGFGVAADEGCDRGRTDIAPACVFYDAGAVQICRPRHRVMELKRVEGGREGAGQCERGCCHGVSC